MTQLGLARIIVFAKDMQEMASFYGNVIGMRQVETADSSDVFISFDAGAAQLSLHAIPERYAAGIEIADPPVPREGTPLKFAFYAKNVAEVRAELVERGANLGPVREFGALHLCDGVDPEGNIFQLSNR